MGKHTFDAHINTLTHLPKHKPRQSTEQEQEQEGERSFSSDQPNHMIENWFKKQTANIINSKRVKTTTTTTPAGVLDLLKKCVMFGWHCDRWILVDIWRAFTMQTSPNTWPIHKSSKTTHTRACITNWQSGIFGGLVAFCHHLFPKIYVKCEYFMYHGSCFHRSFIACSTWCARVCWCLLIYFQRLKFRFFLSFLDDLTSRTTWVEHSFR